MTNAVLELWVYIANQTKKKRNSTLQILLSQFSVIKPNVFKILKSYEINSIIFLLESCNSNKNDNLSMNFIKRNIQRK
jgi:hypothetical protein